MNENIYLTDEQYTNILRKIWESLKDDNFKVSRWDSTFPGDQYTTSNIGFCNDDFTEMDTALFPDQFPKSKDRKYRLSNHKCPFDLREDDNGSGWGSSCFIRCYLFRTKIHDIPLMRTMVEKLLPRQA